MLRIIILAQLSGSWPRPRGCEEHNR
jgi:hypothetical protein